MTHGSRRAVPARRDTPWGGLRIGTCLAGRCLARLLRVALVLSSVVARAKSNDFVSGAALADGGWIACRIGLRQTRRWRLRRRGSDNHDQAGAGSMKSRSPGDISGGRRSADNQEQPADQTGELEGPIRLRNELIGFLILGVRRRAQRHDIDTHCFPPDLPFVSLLKITLRAIGTAYHDAAGASQSTDPNTSMSIVRIRKLTAGYG